jgi:hypothetical protein
LCNRHAVKAPGSDGGKDSGRRVAHLTIGVVSPGDKGSIGAEREAVINSGSDGEINPPK